MKIPRKSELQGKENETSKDNNLWFIKVLRQRCHGYAGLKKKCLFNSLRKGKKSTTWNSKKMKINK